MQFKAIYDTLTLAIAEAQAVAQEIEDLFAEKKIDEGLALRPKWEAADQRVNDIKALYDDLTGLTDKNIARLFVPAAQPKPESENKVMTRDAFDTLTAKEQEKFILVDHGQVVDQVQEV